MGRRDPSYEGDASRPPLTALVDTNILVRHLTGDPPEMAARATAYLGAAHQLLLTDLVAAEVESFYEAPRGQVCQSGEIARRLATDRKRLGPRQHDRADRTAASFDRRRAGRESRKSTRAVRGSSESASSMQAARPADTMSRSPRSPQCGQ